MNYRAILKVVSKAILVLGATMLLPVIFAVIYEETNSVNSLLISCGITFFVGLIMLLFTYKEKQEVFSKEGAVLVALVWVLVSVLGALPFYISKEIPSYVDALFESISGFTTTGSSILTNVEAMSKSMLLWRSFTQWIGGMGVLVFLVAFFNKGEKSFNFLKSEMPGPIKDKLLPKTSSSALVLYGIYILLTVLNVIFLMIGHMSFYEALVHAFATLATGGFGIRADSIGSYSPYIQYVFAVFMVLAGVNFNVYFLLLLRKFKLAFKYKESTIYLIIVFIATVLISVNIFAQVANIKDSFRLAFFQVASIMTTTGFSTCDFALWPAFARTLLLTLMLIGGCAGSTAGGIKVSRISILFNNIIREVKRKIHPRSENAIILDGKEIDTNLVSSVSTYIGLYAILVIGSLLIISLTSTFGTLENISAVLACFNNIGPGLGQVGPMGSYADFNVLNKFLLMALMLLGRLEIYPILVALNPTTYKKQ